jgi:hypothetical protein
LIHLESPQLNLIGRRGKKAKEAAVQGVAMTNAEHGH